MNMLIFVACIALAGARRATIDERTAASPARAAPPRDDVAARTLLSKNRPLDRRLVHEDWTRLAPSDVDDTPMAPSRHGPGPRKT